MERTLNDPNLLSPTGTASTIEVPLPRATAADVEFAQGSLVVSAPESLHVNPAQADGLRDISFDEAFQTIPATPAGSKPLRPVLAYAFAKGVAKLSVTAERRPPQVTVNQLVRAEIASGVVKFNISLYYDIKYSGVKSLRVDVPTTLDGRPQRQQVAAQGRDHAQAGGRGRRLHGLVVRRRDGTAGSQRSAAVLGTEDRRTGHRQERGRRRFRD